MWGAMMRRSLVALLSVLLPAVAVAAETRQAVFQGATSEHKWTLKELNPDLPSDWSGYEFLVLELRASSPQRFSLRVFDAGGVRSVTMHPFGQNVWLRASLPLKYFLRRSQEGFDLASIGNKPSNSYWMGVNGPHGPLNAVEALGVTMQSPLGKPTLEIRNVRLAKEDPGSDFLEKLPVVDEFGQWIHADWPGKAKNLEQLKKEWAEEEKSLKPGDFNYCKYGGYLNTKAKATGFFRVEQIDGKWWFVDPDGHLFLGIGVPGMGTGGAETRVEGREKYYAALPPENLLGPASRRWTWAQCLVPFLEPLPALWRRLAGQGGGTGNETDGGLGPYRRGIVRLGRRRQGSQEALPDDGSGVANRPGPAGNARRVLGRFPPHGGSGGGQSAHTPEGRPLPDWVLRRQRGALARPRSGAGRYGPGRERQPYAACRQSLPGGGRYAGAPEGVRPPVLPEVPPDHQRGGQEYDPNHLNLGLRFGGRAPDDDPHGASLQRLQPQPVRLRRDRADQAGLPVERPAGS